MDSKIKDRRIKLGLTLEQVGNACGVGKSTVRKWETNMIQNMGKQNIMLLAKALNVSPLFILQEEGCPLFVQESKLVESFNLLNNEGKEKIMESINVLVQIYPYCNE